MLDMGIWQVSLTQEQDKVNNFSLMEHTHFFIFARFGHLLFFFITHGATRLVPAT